MNVFLKYYANILCLIRFLDIGVGNEDSKASSIFSIVLVCFCSIILNFSGINILKVSSFLLVFIVLCVFFIVYKVFSKDSIKKRIVDWLDKKTSKEKSINIIISLLFSIIVTVFFLKLHG